MIELTIVTKDTPYEGGGRYGSIDTHTTQHLIPADEIIPTDVSESTDQWDDHFSVTSMPYYIQYADELKAKAAAEKAAAERAELARKAKLASEAEYRERREFERLQAKFGGKS